MEKRDIDIIGISFRILRFLDGLNSECVSSYMKEKEGEFIKENNKLLASAKGIYWVFTTCYDDIQINENDIEEILSIAQREYGLVSIMLPNKGTYYRL